MKRMVLFLYWLACTATLTLVLLSTGYGIYEASFAAVAMLPALFGQRYCLSRLPRGGGRAGRLASVWIALAALAAQYLFLALADSYLIGAGFAPAPPLLANPAFLLLASAAFVLGGMRLEGHLRRRHGYERFVEFVSERRRVTLERAAIRYIESNDSEVYVHTLQGETYRTKTKISQWEALLDERFVRIHRSYIVNSLMVARYRAGRVILADGAWLEVSLSYRERARARFGPRPS